MQDVDLRICRSSLYCMTDLSNVDGDILESVGLLEDISILNKELVHEVVALDPREGGRKVQVVCLLYILKIIIGSANYG